MTAAQEVLVYRCRPCNRPVARLLRDGERWYLSVVARDVLNPESLDPTKLTTREEEVPVGPLGLFGLAKVAGADSFVLRGHCTKCHRDAEVHPLDRVSLNAAKESLRAGKARIVAV